MSIFDDSRLILLDNNKKRKEIDKMKNDEEIKVALDILENLEAEGDFELGFKKAIKWVLEIA